MASLALIPAAEYLRMSTEHQQYSIDNQKAAIRIYASQLNFDITHTYIDAHKTGLVIKEREGLISLLRDVESGTAGPPPKTLFFLFLALKARHPAILVCSRSVSV